MISCKEDGPVARLSSFCSYPHNPHNALAAYALAALASLGAPLSPVWAREDIFQAVTGMDPARELGHRPGASRPSWPDHSLFPGFDTLPPVGASLATSFDNLIRKEGATHFAAGGYSSTAGLRLDPAPVLSLHSTLERGSMDRRIGDTSLVLDHGFQAWESRTVAAFPVSPILTPSAAVAWTSQSRREHALVGIGLRGRMGAGGTGGTGETGAAGLAWSMSTGRRNLDLPLVIDLPGYRPMEIPFLLRQDFLGLALAAGRGPAEMAWSGRLLRARRPSGQSSDYGLSDSGDVTEQSLRLAIRGNAGGGPWRAEAVLENGSGRHFFKGRGEDADGRYQFGYLEALQRRLEARTEGRMDRGPWRAIAFAGASAMEWNGYRPAGSTTGRIFWDRNAVLDSYEGSLLGVFNKETWLFDGHVRLMGIRAGGALERAAAGRWGGRLGLSWQRVDFSALSHITKRTDMGILARTQEELRNEVPGIAAHLITPDLGLSLDLGGGLRLESSLSQAVPVAVEIRNGEGGDAGEGDGSGSWSGYSGGTRAEAVLRFGWR